MNLSRTPLPTREFILDRFNKDVFPDSIVEVSGSVYFVVRMPEGKRLGIVTRSDQAAGIAFKGTAREFVSGSALVLCPMDIGNGQVLRQIFTNLAPTPLGLVTSAGMGDRLGLATPGHARALQTVAARPDAHEVRPIFAQQSMRENNRTGRTPEQVLCDATWGAFQAGWRGPVGADADHLKTSADIDLCVIAGYSFFTIDPGGYVDSSADNASASELERLVSALPWDELESSRTDFQHRYAGKQIDLEGQTIFVGPEDLLRAAAKYGRAVAHVVKMYRYLASKNIPFELEVSVDETETPTWLVEHYVVASELKRLGVVWVSLAPRFVGRFEKGVDYIGDQAAIEADLQGHAAVARLLGPYKISLHSGSDKFRIYSAANQACRGLVHLKTAGTSYLEALRVVSMTDARLFKEILQLARNRYAEDRQTYHVSASLEKVPSPAAIADPNLPDLLEQFDAREVLHVTFGSVLTAFRQELFSNLQANEELYDQLLEKHFIRHLEPFS